MFKLGDYREEEAKPLIQHLKDEGFKIEVRTFIDVLPDSLAFLEGKLSALKPKVKNFEEYDRFLAALKKTLEAGTSETEFRDAFFKELDPALAEKKDLLQKQCESEVEPSEFDEETTEALKAMVGGIVAFDFARDAINLNDINLGEPVGDKLDDPVLRIAVDPDKYDEDEELLKRTFNADLEKYQAIYVDEFSAPLFRDVNESFREAYSDEYTKILSVGLLIENLVEEPSEGKMDLQAFKERCILELCEDDEVVMTIDGRDASDEIARALEKSGVIKIKGSTIKWKI